MLPQTLESRLLGVTHSMDGLILKKKNIKKKKSRIGREVLLVIFGSKLSVVRVGKTETNVYILQSTITKQEKERYT